MAPDDGSQSAGQLSLGQRHQHWRQEWMHNQNELARAQNYAATINEERDALIEELLSKIDGLEEKRLIKELETEKKGIAWQHSQELGRATRAKEILQHANEALQKEVTSAKENSSHLQDQLDKLRESKREIIEQKNGLHERIMDLEAEVRQQKETNRAIQRRYNPPSSVPRDLRGGNSRTAVASRTHRVNENILKKDFRAYDRELKSLVDLPIEINPGDPVLAQLLQGPKLCRWYYLQGFCKKNDCGADHDHPKLSSNEMDRLLYLGRQEMCPRQATCSSRQCFFSHANVTSSAATGLKRERVKDEESSPDDEGRHVRGRY